MNGRNSHFIMQTAIAYSATDVYVKKTMTEKLISIVQAAQELGRNKQYLFKLVDRFGLEKTLERSSGSKGQKIAYISMDGYKKIQDYINSTENTSVQEEATVSGYGVFYLIQLEPEHDPDRFKLGFATNIEERLRAHKTSAPYSTVVKTWPCKLLWEKTAIDSVTQGCERIHTEVFRANSIQEIEKRCNKFFALMPVDEEST